jgi:hypothetical protein
VRTCRPFSCTPAYAELVALWVGDRSNGDVGLHQWYLNIREADLDDWWLPTGEERRDQAARRESEWQRGRTYGHSPLPAGDRSGSGRAHYGPVPRCCGSHAHADERAQSTARGAFEASRHPIELT